MTDIIFVSKVDTWLTVVLVMASLLMISAPFIQWKCNANTSIIQNSMLLFLPISFTLLLLWLPYFKIQYTVTNDELLIHNGFSTHTIYLTDIVEMTPSRSLLSAPALSLDRIKISYHSKKGIAHTLISPADKRAFYQALAARQAFLLPKDDSKQP